MDISRSQGEKNRSHEIRSEVSSPPRRQHVTYHVMLFFMGMRITSCLPRERIQNRRKVALSRIMATVYTYDIVGVSCTQHAGARETTF